jgi:hypothetical protein
VGLHRDAHECGKFVALRSCGEDHNFAVGKRLKLRSIDKCLLIYLKKPQVLHYLNIDLHRAALDEDLATYFLGLLNYAHQALELRRESTDDETAWRSGDYLVEVFANHSFRERESGALHVGRVCG